MPDISTARSAALIRLVPLLLLAMAGTTRADTDVNLARAKGTLPLGSGSSGPFTIHKINDGRTDAMGMWCSTGAAESFAGVQLGQTPVTFNTVRFYLFNGRSAFTGWRLEGSNDCQIDEDDFTAQFFDPELIASDEGGVFENAKAKQNNVVTVSFAPVSYKFVRLVFRNRGGLVGVPELEVFLRDDNVTPKAGVSADKEIAIDDVRNTITLPGPANVADVIAKLKKFEGNSLEAYDPAGMKLKPGDLLKSGCTLLAKHSTGGGDVPWEVQYKCYTIIDRTAAPIAQKPYVPSTRPAAPPKPSMIPASAPAAPKETVNLVEGKAITASIDPVRAADLAKSGEANWFAPAALPPVVQRRLGRARRVRLRLDQSPGAFIASEILDPDVGRWGQLEAPRPGRSRAQEHPVERLFREDQSSICARGHRAAVGRCACEEVHPR